MPHLLCPPSNPCVFPIVRCTCLALATINLICLCRQVYLVNPSEAEITDICHQQFQPSVSAQHVSQEHVEAVLAIHAAVKAAQERRQLGSRGQPEFNLRDLCKAADLARVLIPDQKQLHQFRLHLPQETGEAGDGGEGVQGMVGESGFHQVRTQALASVCFLVYGAPFKEEAHQAFVQELIDKELCLKG